MPSGSEALQVLPDDVVGCICSHVRSARQLANCSRINRSWRLAALAAAELRCSVMLFWKDMPMTAGKQWLWAYAEMERVEDWIGCTRMYTALVHVGTLSWNLEWVEMNVEECMLTSQEAWALPARFAQDGEESIEQRTLQEQPQIQWLLANGWGHASAVAHSLLSTYCNTAIGNAIALRQPTFPASTFTLCAGLTAAALRMLEPAPDVFFALHGFAGLETQDKAWSVLRRRKISSHLVTTCVAGGNIADARTFPPASDGRCHGFHKPNVGPDGRIEYVLQKSAVVRFVSRSPDEQGTLRSLVPTCATGVYDSSSDDPGETVYDLPPLTQVTLVDVLESGTWSANGLLVHRRCFVVEVAWGPQVRRSLLEIGARTGLAKRPRSQSYP